LPFEQVRNENVRSNSANSSEASSSSISPKRPKGKSSSEQQPLEKA
ncbi:6395_t:CDS:1, partial [Funneliformis mosseae]